MDQLCEARTWLEPKYTTRTPPEQKQLYNQNPARAETNIQPEPRPSRNKYTTRTPPEQKQIYNQNPARVETNIQPEPRPSRNKYTTRTPPE